jgi:hypothetical protein
MPVAPWQKYQPPRGTGGTGPVGDARGVAVATVAAVGLDGDGC